MKYASFDQYLDFYRTSSDEDTQALARFLEDYMTDHPSETAAFDPHAWFAANLNGTAAGVNKENWFGWNGPNYGGDNFRAEMMKLWLTGLYRAQRGAASRAAMIDQYPEDYAAFDADAWFAGYYGGILGDTKAQYVEAEGLTGEEDFRAAMFVEWVGGTRSRFNGLVVTVNGTPIQFGVVRTVSGEVAEPVARGGRILAPLRTVAEAMDFSVAYDGTARTVSCIKGDVTVTFTLDSTVYFVASSSGTAILTLDMPPAAEDGRTYLPLRALGEALGYTVIWNTRLQTAALTAN